MTCPWRIWRALEVIFRYAGYVAAEIWGASIKTRTSAQIGGHRSTGVVWSEGRVTRLS